MRAVQLAAPDGSTGLPAFTGLGAPYAMAAAELFKRISDL